MQTIPQNETKVPVSTRLTKAVDQAVEIEVARRSTTKQDFIEEAIRHYLGLSEEF